MFSCKFSSRIETKPHSGSRDRILTDENEQAVVILVGQRNDFRFIEIPAHPEQWSHTFTKHWTHAEKALWHRLGFYIPQGSFQDLCQIRIFIMMWMKTCGQIHMRGSTDLFFFSCCTLVFSIYAMCGKHVPSTLSKMSSVSCLISIRYVISVSGQDDHSPLISIAPENIA